MTPQPQKNPFPGIMQVSNLSKSMPHGYKAKQDVNRACYTTYSTHNVLKVSQKEKENSTHVCHEACEILRITKLKRTQQTTCIARPSGISPLQILS